MPWHRHATWMALLDRLQEVLLRWMTSGETDYRAADWRHWMPGDYAGESAPKKRKKVSLRKQLQAVAAAYGGKYK